MCFLFDLVSSNRVRLILLCSVWKYSFIQYEIISHLYNDHCYVASNYKF